MQSKSKSSKALVVSFTLHLIAGVIGFSSGPENNLSRIKTLSTQC